MEINKSSGTTPTEKRLAELCDKTFLKLWSYPNPVKEDGDELCDLLVVFENRVFIFFDRESLVFEKEDIDIQITWKRWKKEVIDKQIRTVIGAEKYLKRGSKVFLDAKLTMPFPHVINSQSIAVHKIIVAHGAATACKKYSAENIYGSLAITYSQPRPSTPIPFHIYLDKNNPVHVFDSHNLSLVLNELDTIFDFSAYLDSKVSAIKKFGTLAYAGEEDLLAHYLLNFDDNLMAHIIGGVDEDVDCVIIGEGEWKDYIESDLCKTKRQANEISYLWDDLIQLTGDFALKGMTIGDSMLKGESAIREMAKEPRFIRRLLGQRLKHAINSFPISSNSIERHLSMTQSFFPNKAYVFLQLQMQKSLDYENEYRPFRQRMLEIACGALKNKMTSLETIVGIAFDPVKFSEILSEDFILLNCQNWTDQDRKYYEEANKMLQCWSDQRLKIQKGKIYEFPSPEENITSFPKSKKLGRNDPCYCGSGIKYKKCCGAPN